MISFSPQAPTDFPHPCRRWKRPQLYQQMSSPSIWKTLLPQPWRWVVSLYFKRNKVTRKRRMHENLHACLPPRFHPCVIIDTWLSQESARANAVNAVKQGFGKREVVVRINGIETEWFEKDLKDIAEAKPNAVILPKVSPTHAFASRGHGYAICLASKLALTHINC